MLREGTGKRKAEVGFSSLPDTASTTSQSGWYSWSPWRDQSTSPLGYSHLNPQDQISLPYSHGSLLAEIYCHPGLAFQLLIDCLWDACNKLHVYLACEIQLLSSLVPGC